MASFKLNLGSLDLGDILKILELVQLIKSKKYMSALVSAYAPAAEEELDKLPEDASNSERAQVCILAIFRKLGVQNLGIKDNVPK